ncbi:unnamed protein product [Durusdinium trenchii]|uniref:Uncharacterized protein n=1 Tax=Durusdinium trenchii TaxID=1381693 RepID=A0ABP0NDP9_9DINO
MSPAASPLVADTDDRVVPLFSGQGRSVTVPAHSKTHKERPPADFASETRSEEAERFQLTQYCDCGHWMHLAIFGLFLIVDSSKYMVDVRAISHNPVTAQALVFLQDLISVLICVVAILRYIGPRGVVDTFCSAELFRCLPTAVLFSLSNAALAHAIGLGIGAATAVALGSLYMPMSALVSCLHMRLRLARTTRTSTLDL